MTRRSSRTGTRVVKTEDEWREQLPGLAFEVLRDGNTERAGTGQYATTKEDGIYRCGACDTELFDSATKYDSGTGWPSFTEPVREDAVDYVRDIGWLGIRTEVRCRACASHLGHVFGDGPSPGGQRFCMNSVALRLDPR